MDTKSFDMNEALKTVMKGATLAKPTVSAADGREYALVPKDFELKDISDPHRVAPRPPEGVIKVDDRASLVSYAKRHQNPTSMIFADYNAGTITATLDWHPHNQIKSDYGKAGPRRHHCILTLLPSEEFSRWDAMQGKLHRQADFALFLEENASDIWSPEPAIMLELARDLEGVTGQTFKSRTRLTDGSHGFRFETENKIVSEVQAPEEFRLSIPVYHGEEPEVLTAKFRWRPSAEGLFLGFVWHRVEYMRRARFNQIATQAAEDTGLPWIAGRA